MKFLPFILMSLLFLIYSAPVQAEGVGQIYAEAQRDFVAGNMEEAKEKFGMVLAINPRHQPSINYLRMIASRETQDGGAAKRQQSMESLILPEITFRDTTLGSVLDFLAQSANKQAGGNLNINFVRQLPPGYEDTKKITLKLNNTPFTAVLRYVGQLANVRFSVERYAIVVKPTEVPDAPAPAETGEPSVTQ